MEKNEKDQSGKSEELAKDIKNSEVINVTINQGGSIKAETATASAGPGPDTSVTITGLKEVPFDPRYWTQRISEFCAEQTKNELEWAAAKAHIDTALYKMNQILK